VQCVQVKQKATVASAVDMVLDKLLEELTDQKRILAEETGKVKENDGKVHFLMEDLQDALGGRESGSNVDIMSDEDINAMDDAAYALLCDRCEALHAGSSRGFHCNHFPAVVSL
jgi:hypothetical protein